ncbi:hypothetical protein Tco_0595056 [Tanacetum coccineum]
MMAIFHDMIEKTMEVFMDDFSVFGNSFKNYLSRLDKMLQRCEDTNLCLNWEKSHFMVKEGIVLGHKISKNGIEGRSSRLKCYIWQSEEHLKRDCPRYNHKTSQDFIRNEDHVSGSRANGYDNDDVMMAMSAKELLDWIMDSGGSYHMTYRIDHLFNFEEYDSGNILLGDGRDCVYEGRSGKIKVIKGLLVELSGTRRANCVYTLDGVYTTMYEEWGRQTFECYRDTTADWAEDTTMSTYLVNRSPSSTIGFKTPIDMLRFFGWLASINQRMLEPVKVKCILLDTIKVYWVISFGGTGSVQVLQGFEFEEEPLGDHTFEVEPHGNIDHVVGSHEVQTRDLIDYHLTCDRERHLTQELFRYRVDSNEAAFAIAKVEKIYAHESLTFNDTVACEVISKWKAGLKEDMLARSYVYVLSNICRKISDDIDGYY